MTKHYHLTIFEGSFLDKVKSLYETVFENPFVYGVLIGAFLLILPSQIKDCEGESTSNHKRKLEELAVTQKHEVDLAEMKHRQQLEIDKFRAHPCNDGKVPLWNFFLC